ncbi:hypothetical protein BGX38DRAFT_152478 [Terfezia claveryi]|nr:hypothetical protein BGX38DRAFT_152478 [Terfezia claveryi]
MSRLLYLASVVMSFVPNLFFSYLLKTSIENMPQTRCYIASLDWDSLPVLTLLSAAGQSISCLLFLHQQSTYLERK